MGNGKWGMGNWGGDGWGMGAEISETPEMAPEAGAGGREGCEGWRCW